MNDKSRTEYSMINIITGIGGYIVNILMSFICRMVFARSLGAEYLGINGLFTDILSMLSLTELGIGTAMIYALYKPIAEHDQEKIAAYMKIYGKAYKIVGTIIALLGIIIMPFLGIIIKDTPSIAESISLIYVLFLFSTASSYFFSYRSSIIIASQRNYVVVGISYAVVIVQNILQILVLVVAHNYLIYLIIQVIAVLVSNILISKKAGDDYPYIQKKDTIKLTKEEKIGLLKNIKAITVTKLSGILVNSTDNIVITFFNGLITTGVVSNYSLLTTTLNSLVNQIFTSITASLGNLNAVESDEQKFRVFKALNLTNFWVYGWATIGFIVMANDIVALFFGENYVMDMNVSIVLAINFYMLGMQCVTGLYKSTMGLFRYGQYMLLVTALLNLIGDLILGQKFGALGIFAATAIARLFTNTWYEPYVVYKRGLKQNPLRYILRYIGFVFLLIITTMVCYGVCSFVQGSRIQVLVIKGIICICLPNIIFVIAFFKWPEFKYLCELFLRIKKKILKK